MDKSELQRIVAEMRQSYLDMLAMHAHEVTYAGGPGESIESAVVILGAASSAVGVHAEYRWLEGRYGERNQAWELLRQALNETPDGRRYDIITIRLPDGTEREIYFDISDFFGK